MVNELSLLSASTTSTINVLVVEDLISIIRSIFLPSKQMTCLKADLCEGGRGSVSPVRNRGLASFREGVSPIRKQSPFKTESRLCRECDSYYSRLKADVDVNRIATNERLGI